MSQLFAYTEEPHEFSNTEVTSLINAIDNAKILDPACGSGAFPMGVLHKMVHILHKLDPDNEKWKQKQIDKVLEVPDITVRDQLIEDIEDSFQTSELDYGRKLYLIENCIYGIDIQPIAVQIAKLRFFISLIVDQGIDTERKNLGIRPLPNLETKFVAANTLISIETPDQMMLRNPEIDIKEKDLKQVREKYFSARTSKTKEKYRLEDARLRAELAELFKNDGFSAETTHKLAHWDPYDQNASADFFDSEWMFAIKEGFDVVIANPPYVRQEKIKHIKPALKKEYGDFFCGTADIYTYFYKRGIDLLKENGHLCFIAPNKFMRAGYGKNLRNLLTTEVELMVIVDFCELPVFEAGTDPAILLVEHCKSDNSSFKTAIIKEPEEIENVDNVVTQRGFILNSYQLSDEGWALERPEELSLMEKLHNSGVPLVEYVKGRFYRGILTGFNEAFLINTEIKEFLIKEDRVNQKIIKPWLDGHDIKKWEKASTDRHVIFTRRGINIGKYPSIKRYLEKYRKDLEPKKSAQQRRGRKPGTYKWYEVQDNIAYYKEFDHYKLVFNETSKELHAYIDYDKTYINKTGFIIVSDNNEYLLGVLNSKLMDYFYRLNFPAWGDPWKGGRVQFRKDRMVSVPVVSATDKQKAPVTDRVKKILKNPGSPDVPRLEKEIDHLVYKLYKLTPEEIAIVESRR